MSLSPIKERVEALEQWILANPNPPRKMPWIALYQAGRVIYAVARDVINGQLTLHAMSLVYTTLLSIVPLLALSFSVLKAMDVHQRIQPFLYQFFEPMGPQGIDMANKILEFVDNIKVGVLGSVGLALLIYTVISLVQKIEFAFNTIWRVPQMRSLTQRFSNYVSVIMIGPLMMVLAVGITATIFSSTVVQTLIAIEPLGTVVLFLSRFTPFFIVVLAFTFMYVFMPNTKVGFKYALIGGVIAGVSWQALSMLFASFVAGSARYEAIYSSFAIGIILLIWLYLNWLVLLVGSSLVFYIQNPRAISKRREVRVSPELQEQVALVMMWMVCKPFSEGKATPQQEQLEEEMGIPAEVSRKISDKLIRGGLLMLAGPEGDGLVPARALDLISIEEILAVIRTDEERLVRRLPKVLPDDLSPLPNCSDTRTMAELLKPRRD